MLNAIWAMMILVGVVYGLAAGNMEAVSNGFLSSSKEAVNMCVTMLGVIGFWMGMMEIAGKSGVITQLTKFIDPLVSFMFPRIPKEHKSREYITTNMIANILGLGWGATPPGLKAMEELAKLQSEGDTSERDLQAKRFTPENVSSGHSSQSVNAGGRRSADRTETVRSASDEMCTFLVLNISSLQLIPINIIAYRSQYGSVNPAGIIGPAIAATAVSTVVGILFCKLMMKKKA